MSFGRQRTAGSRERDAERTTRRPRGRKARLLLELQARLDQAFEQLQAHEQTLTRLAGEVSAQDLNHTRLEHRLGEIEARYESDLSQMRAARARHQQDLAQLHETVERHTSEVTALEHLLETEH